MKTRCPACQTIFRVTAEQLKARAGKVRCGQCQAVFNALDTMLEELPPVSSPPGMPAPIADAVAKTSPASEETPSESPAPESQAPTAQNEATEEQFFIGEPEPPAAEEPETPAVTQELGKAAGLILPRETTDIPGYSKWAEGVVTTPGALPAEQSSHWPFTLAAAILLFGLAGQVVFHFRSELAASSPSLRPALEFFAHALGGSLPLPRNTELIGIETSDLQTDATRNNQLILNATLRNRAPYAQAYPSLELTLTDTQDVAIVRRIFSPVDYLAAPARTNPEFPGNSDVSVRLWLETDDIEAAGYRLFVFYP